MPQNAFLILTNSRSFGQPKNDANTLFFPTLHPLSLVIFATATVLAFVLLHKSRFLLQLLYIAWSSAYSEIGPEVTLRHLATSLRERLQRAFTRANELHWTAQYTRLSQRPCSYLHAGFWDLFPGLNRPPFLGLQVLVEDAAGVAPFLHHFLVVFLRDVDCLLYKASTLGANHRLDRLHTSVSRRLWFHWTSNWTL